MENKLLAQIVLEGLELQTMPVLYGAFANAEIGPFGVFDESALLTAIGTKRNFVIKTAVGGRNEEAIQMTHARWDAEGWTPGRIVEATRSMCEDIRLSSDLRNSDFAQKHRGVVVQELFEAPNLVDLGADEDNFVGQVVVHVVFGALWNARATTMATSIEKSSDYVDVTFDGNKLLPQCLGARPEHLQVKGTCEMVVAALGRHGSELVRVAELIQRTFAADWFGLHCFFDASKIVVNQIMYPSHIAAFVGEKTDASVEALMKAYRTKAYVAVDAKTEVLPKLLDHLDHSLSLDYFSSKGVAATTRTDSSTVAASDQRAEQPTKAISAGFLDLSLVLGIVLVAAFLGRTTIKRRRGQAASSSSAGLRSDSRAIML